MALLLMYLVRFDWRGFMLVTILGSLGFALMLGVGFVDIGSMWWVPIAIFCLNTILEVCLDGLSPSQSTERSFGFFCAAGIVGSIYVFGWVPTILIAAVLVSLVIQFIKGLINRVI